ncbi:unnamed protein product [Penicillium salamii]|nr:unnamed protein product [Penicillium salamii]
MLISSLLYLVIGQFPLKPIAEQIQTKYLLFAMNAKGHVAFRSSKALEVIPNHTELARANGNDGQEVQSGEIDIVLHFLDNVCSPALY